MLMPPSTGATRNHLCRACAAVDLMATKPSLIEDDSLEGVRGLLVRHHPSAVDQALLTLCSEDNLVGSRTDPPVVSWLLRLIRDIPGLDLRPLVAAAVAGGLLRAQPTLEDLGFTTWLYRWHNKWHDKLRSATDRIPAAHINLWRQIGIFAPLSSWHNATERIGVQAEIRRLAETHPRLWARSLPWLFRLGRKLDGLDVALTVVLARTEPVVARALGTCARNPVAHVRLRAAGTMTLQREDPGDAEPWLLDALANAVDRRRDVFPRPLAGPAASWLGDTDLEDLIRGSARLGLREFADVVRDQGAAEEEGLTQQLLALLAKQFERINHVVEISGGRPAPTQIALAQRTVPKTEEKTIGADLGIVVHAELPDALMARFGDLVQVKKTILLTSPGLLTDGWRIDVDQLAKLLRYSATATYWLIRRSGEVLVVPAKLLMALYDGRATPRPATFTARYGDVRHAAIPLEQHLVDLVIGMWAGSAAPDTLSVADGTNGRTRPRHILDVSVRRTQQG